MAPLLAGEVEIKADHSVSVFLESRAVDIRTPLKIRISASSPGKPRVHIILFEIGGQRSRFALGTTFEVPPHGEVAQFEIALGGREPGPYVLFAEAASEDDPLQLYASLPDLPGGLIWLTESGDAPTDVPAAVGLALENQRAYVERELRFDGYEGDQCYSICFLLEGCKLDHWQPIEGGFIAPLAFGTEPDSHLSAINRMLAPKARFELTETERIRYASGHPLSQIVFTRVRAPNPASAASAVQGRISLLLGIIAMDRGAPPRIVARLFEETKEQRPMLVLEYGEYQGNLLGDMFGGTVTEQLNECIQAVEADPWISLVVGFYNDAVAESNYLFRVVKLWATLEACAKRRDLELQEVRGKKGTYLVESIEVKGKDLATVASYVQKEVHPVEWADNRKIDIEAARTFYQVRNIGAHEGVLDYASLSKAESDSVSYLFEEGRLRQLEEWVRGALWSEIRRANREIERGRPR